MPLAFRAVAKYMPAIDSYLTVDLGGEMMRCVVVDHVDRDRVLIEIDSVPLSKNHQYRKGDRTGARRRVAYGRDVWEALEDRDFLANRSPKEPLKPKKTMAVKSKKKVSGKKAAAKKKRVA